MIDKILVRGFRKHKKKKVIRLSKRVTTLHGGSATGKSTIVRALEWVHDNSPSGDSMINWDSKSALVRVETDNHKIIRKRGKNENYYKVDKKKLKSFGVGVPSQIREILNLSDINFQGQFDPHFWFSLTPGEVSRKLNSIINLEVIDNTLSNLNSMSRNNKAEAKVLEHRISELKRKKKQLRFVRTMNVDLKALVTTKTRFDENADNARLLDNLYNMAVELRSKAKNARNRASGAAFVVSLGDTYSTAASDRQRLSELISTGRQAERLMNNKPPSLDSVTKARDSLESVRSDIYTLELGVSALVNKRKKVCQTKEDLKTYRKRLSKVEGDKCPLCGNKLKKGQVA